ncbi:MAG: UDP-N-acetylglucosamine 2-epimerase (non-hydrolyzing) [Anaerolineaceae bacterium]|nr:UDP-N-acetylglucosamine 2-epimerase (non-hydrolyzing) [Anaerolineaceae bacterium]
MLVCNVVGARPNFMKMAPVVRALQNVQLPQILVHTGQHYDTNMSQVFFDELGLPQPDIYLEIGSDTHARQTARIMAAFEEVCQQQQPDLVVVSGDVNSTLAAALVAAKLHIPVAHIEAGLRSFDRAMPEEINRVLTDHISDLLFTTEEIGNHHLANEGIEPEKVHFVGNCMVDTLLQHVHKAVEQSPWTQQGVLPGEYALLTLHRPSNVDDRGIFTALLDILGQLSQDIPILFPVHPRTQHNITEWQIQLPATFHLIEPQPYLAFLGLMAKARYVLTDSGGVQQETTMLNVPCLTLRTTTELPVTITHGTNKLVGTDPAEIEKAVLKIMSADWQLSRQPPLWDGHASQRIVQVIQQWVSGRV